MRSSFRKTLLFVVAGLASICMNGCASSHITMASRTGASDIAPLKRILVIASFDRASFTDLMYQGFESAWKDRLDACGIKFAILNSGIMDVNIEERFGKAARSLDPGSILRIWSTGGTVHVHRDERNVRFGMKIIDVETEKTTWMASSELEISLGYMTDQQRQEVGSKFARSILSRLHADNVLTSCPATLEWPAVPRFPPTTGARS